MKFMWQVIRKRRDPEREVSHESVKDEIMKNDLNFSHMAYRRKWSLVWATPKDLRAKTTPNKNDAKVQEGPNNDGLTKAF